ncbi:MAG TPA: TatD family hydrolase [Mycobacteriales bacterium]|nr:TatD family hydrolase [Mycobacteriales bacterium]
MTGPGSSERERSQRERPHSPRTGEPPPPPEPLPAAVFDSHCHLDAMGVDIGQSLAAARSVGVARVVTVGDTLESSRWCAATAAAYDEVVAAVAVHPNEVGGIDESTWDGLAELAARPEVRAVGETGLDFYRDRVAPAEQQAAFRRHIALAKEVGKALVIHDRDAHDAVLRVLEEEGAPEWTVFHCFSGDVEMARRCVRAGYLLSFAGTVTFKNAGGLRDAAAVVPLDQLLVETDAPFLTPAPYRGRPNAPYLMPLTVRALADVKTVHIEQLCEEVTRTGERVFGGW